MKALMIMITVTIAASNASAYQEFTRLSHDEVRVELTTAEGNCDYEIRGKITKENARTMSYRPMNVKATTKTEFCEDYVELVSRIAHTNKEFEQELVKNHLADNQ